MAIATYAGLRERNDSIDFTLSPTSGGATTVATNFYYFVYGIARGGINKATAMGQVAVDAGEKLEFTINATARPSGLQPFGFALGAATTNDETQAKLLGVAWVIESDQETNLDLPLTLIFNSDNDLTIEGTVTAIADRPSNPVNGCIRYVSNDSKFYQWDGDGFYGDPSWTQVYGTQLYLANTTDLRSGLKWKGGCDAPINTIPLDPQPNYYGIISPPWSGEGEVSTPIKLWLLNGLTEGSGVILPIDSQINLVTLVNDSPELGARLLSGKVLIVINGVVRRLDGFRTTVNASAVWNAGTPFYYLESQLNRGYALEVEYTCTATVGNGDRLTIYLRDDGVFGTPSTAIQLGTSVFKSEKEEQNQSEILPDLLGIKRDSGQGQIITDGQNTAYFYNNNGELGLTQGIVADTAGQKIAISGIRNGAIACYQSAETLPSTEALRAVISTEAGTATASDWTTPVTVGSNGRIEVAIALPTAIRSDYPDTLIAGNTEGERVIPQMRVFVRVSGSITELASVAVEADDEQVLIISDLSGGSVVGSVPSNGDASFNLWPYGAMTPTATGTGSLTTGDYEIAIAWDYPSPNLGITKISHDINDGCIPTLPLSFADATFLVNIFSIIQKEGVAIAQRQILDFDSRLVEIEDDPSNDRIRLRFPESPRTTVTTSNPTVTDDSDSDYRVGDIWVNTNSNPVGFFIAEDVAPGSAVWITLGGGGAGTGLTAIADLTTLKALSGVTNDATYLLKTNAVSNLNNNIYRFDSSSDADANDNTVIVHNTVSGRFLKVGQLKADEIVETTRKFATQAQLDAITSNTTALGGKSNTDHTHVTEQGGLVTGDGTDQIILSPPTTVSDIKFLALDPSKELDWIDPPTAIATQTTAQYTQPALNGTVVVTVESTANFVPGQTYVVIQSGGTYLVTNVGGLTTATFQFLKKGSTGANPTVIVPTDRKVSLTGSLGADGASSVTTILEDFTIPAVNLIQVVDVASSEAFNLDIIVHLATAGSFKVTSKDDNASPNTVTLENLGGNNASAGSVVANGSQLVISGPPGETGSVSATSSLVFDSAIAPPSTAANERKVFPDSTNSNKLSLRDVSDGTVNVFAFLSDILPTVLTGFVEGSLTAIAATDTILEAFGKVQKYLTDFLTNFNVADKLLKLGSSGEIPKLDARLITQDVIIPANFGQINDGTYYLTVSYPPNFKQIDFAGITGLNAKTNTGTITIKINGTAITGLDSLSVTATKTDYTATGQNTFVATNDLEITIVNTDNNNPMQQLAFTLYGVINP